MKVHYKALWGGESTAYLHDENPIGENIFNGIDKHSDIKIRVKWTGNEWIEIEEETNE